MMPRRIVTRLLSLALTVTAVLSLAACGKRDYTYCEIGFELPRGYRETVTSDFDLAFEKRGSIIGIRRLSFDAVEKDGLLATHSPYTLAEIYRDRLGVTNASTVFTHGDIPYFVYSISDGYSTYAYMPTFYRTRFAYFVITYICKNTIDEGERVEFLAICDTVYILPQHV